MSTPNQWELSTVAQEFDVQLGKRLDAAVNRGEMRWCINNRGVRWGRVLVGEAIEAPLTPADIRDLRLTEGDVLVCEGGEIGRAAVWHGELAEAYFLNTLHRLRSRGRYSPRLLVAFLERWAATGELSAVVGKATLAHLTKENLLRVPLPVLPASEQMWTVEALESIDSLVAALERLIAKKRDIKQGLMQELLTGRTRLPGFAGDWTTLRVAAVSHLKARIGWQGLTTEEYRASGSHRLVGGTDFADGRVNWNTTPYVDKWRYDQDPNIQLRLGDVLITKDGTIGKVAMVDRLPGPTTLNSGVFVLRPKQGAYDPTFLFCMLRSRAFDEFVAGLSAGSTINHLYQKDLVTLEFQVPPCVEEQAAIAKVILDADAELTALDRRLVSARNIKQGMMQELLTGRTRLVSKDAA